MHQGWEAAKPSWNRGVIEVIGSKVEPSQARKEEEGTIGMDDAKEPAATEVQPNYMACHLITCDPIPWAAITTLLPRLCFGIRRDTIAIAIRRTGIFDRKWLLKLEQSKGLIMRAQWFSEIRKRGGKKLRAWEEENKTEEEFRHHSTQNQLREWGGMREMVMSISSLYMKMIHSNFTLLFFTMENFLEISNSNGDQRRLSC